MKHKHPEHDTNTDIYTSNSFEKKIISIGFEFLSSHFIHIRQKRLNFSKNLRFVYFKDYKYNL